MKKYAIDKFIGDLGDAIEEYYVALREDNEYSHEMATETIESFIRRYPLNDLYLELREDFEKLPEEEFENKLPL